MSTPLLIIYHNPHGGQEQSAANATETAKGKPANVKNYGTAPKPMQTETQEQMPQNYGTVPNAVNLPPKTTAQTEMQQNNINLPPAVENGLQGQNKNISIREQIKNNIDELKKMQAVSAVNPDTLKPGESGFMGNVINYFKSLGNIIRRPVLATL
jgi:hypothetical protein